MRLSLLSFLTALAIAQTPASAPIPQKPGVPGVQHPMAQLVADAEYPIGGNPDWLASGEDPAGHPMAWTNSRPTDFVFRMDPLTNKTVASVPVKKPCSGLVVALGALWAPSCEDGVVHRIDGASNMTVARIAAAPSNNEGGIAFGAGSVWLPIQPGDTLARIDPATNTISARIKTAGGSHTAVFGYGRVWVSSTDHSLVSVVHPATNKVIAEIPTDAAPRFMAVGEGFIWTLNQTNGTVSKIDPIALRVVATIAVGVPGTGGDIAAGEGAVWVTQRTMPVSKIDPISNRVVAQFFGPGGDAIRVLYGSVWLSNGRWGNVWRFHPGKVDQAAPASWQSHAQPFDLDGDKSPDLLVEDLAVWHVGKPALFRAQMLNPKAGASLTLQVTLNDRTTKLPMTQHAGVWQASFTGDKPRWIHYSVCVTGEAKCSPSLVTASPTTTSAYAERTKRLVPDAFMAPRPPDLEGYTWHPLAPEILEADYQFLLAAGRKPESIRKDQDYGELKRHIWEFRNASAFAYAVLTADGTAEPACVYINPSRKSGYDAQVRVWIAQPGANPAFDKALEAAVREWVKAKWPFEKTAFPGLDMSMEQWNALPERTED
jgi:YVTN family beta-propeller protein